jgi:hypothetical protein
VSIGKAAEGDAKYDTFNGATDQLTISVITDGTIFAYNVVITLGALISQAGKCELLANCLGEVEAPEVVPVASDHTIFYGAGPFIEWVETSYSADNLALTTNLATPARVMYLATRVLTTTAL